MNRIFCLVITFLCSAFLSNANEKVTVAVLKYNGGGDWYANPTSLPNLVKYANKQLGVDINKEVGTVEVGSPDIFQYPFIHMTGHGNVLFSNSDVDNLRTYLLSGGFLHIDDNYGMDVFVRREMKKVFPELEFVELPLNHSVYKSVYEFNDGLPKVHEHDKKPPQGFGLIYQGRLVCFYSYESDLGDGWEDKTVHNDSELVREKALKMGCNLLSVAFSL